MDSSNSLSVFLLKIGRKKNGRIPIYACVRFEGRNSDLSVHRSTFEERWCPILGKIDHHANEANSINRYLYDVHAKLLEYHRQLIEEGAVINAKVIKLRYLGKDKVVRTLKDIIEFHRDHEMPKLAKGTIKNYSATETYLKRFVKKKSNPQDVRLSFIDYAFVVEFESFLRKGTPINKTRPLTNNGIMKDMERFKKLVGTAFKFGCIPQNPFNLYRMKFEEYESDFLEEEEIQR